MYINPKINVIDTKVNMIDHGWFSYWDNPYHNAMLDHGSPWIIFISRQYLWQCDIGPWLIMVDFHIEAIFVRTQCSNMVDHDWFTMVYFDIETILVKMRCSTMANHGWLSYCNNICHKVTLDHCWPWLNMIDHNLPWSTMLTNVDHG